VRSSQAGHGGDGQESVTSKPRTVRNFKFQPGRQQRKFIELAPGVPADGGAGGDVLLFVDPLCESLLHLRERRKWSAKDGPDGSAAPAAVGDRSKARAAPPARPLRIPVPPGTVVRRKRGKVLLGDLVRPGQTLLVASGGRGGLGASRDTQPREARTRTSRDKQGDVVVETTTLASEGGAGPGEPGEAVALELLLRVVADAGIVGLPNAGKSSLLAAVTRASPEVAPYPFTTLMPNLGVLTHDPLSLSGSPPPVLADLPGLIRGAHKGVGLGRAFLRHLRRTRALVVVVDCSQPEPWADYLAVREELWLYNPGYCARPHLLALNKIDALAQLEGAPSAQQLVGEFQQSMAEHQARLGAPTGIFPVSALTGEGLRALLDALQVLIREAGEGGGDAELQLTPEERAMVSGKSNR
jgi:GTPase involved in cell partitioning and DNA repair